MEGKGVFKRIPGMAATRSDRRRKLTVLARQLALQSSPQSAENEIHQKFAVSGVDQDPSLSCLWKNDRYRGRSRGAAWNRAEIA